MKLGQSENCGVLLWYFIAKDCTLPLRYAYGIRKHSIYPLQLIRTSPIQEVDRITRFIATYGCYYRLGREIISPQEQQIYLSVFADVELPIGDNEIIGPPVSLVLN